jgi:quinol-cytochrome oxidoreductase complex cytochrome b subunit
VSSGDRRPFFSELLLLEACLWLLLFGLIVTPAVFLPADRDVKADPFKSAPEGIKPEWYFPFLDRSTRHGKKSLGWTVLFAALLVAKVVLQAVAWIAPRPARPRQAPAAETFSLSRGLVLLGLLWTVIGFLVFYLYQLVKENTRIRRLYEEEPAGRG